MNVVVVGGGTAGWITALYFQKTNPGVPVTVIESEQIGILGAGEGTTPNFPHLMQSLGISVSELITECQATIKNGIKFTNWNSERNFYYPFFAQAGLGEQAYRYPFGTSLPTFITPILGAMRGVSSFKYDLTSQISELNLVPMYDKGFAEDSDIIPGTAVATEWALHFDARKLAAFLRTKAVERGALRIEGTVEQVNAAADGYITSLTTTAGEIPADFVFDCSGFARLIVGKFYKGDWKSHSAMLPAKKAVPFFLPLDDEIPPYTESIAMDYGWMWKIPTQERYGCGYVFDSDFISDDKALEEIETRLGRSVDSPKTFTFDPGCYRNPWVKNSLAVGLSSGFIEPLEATSIWQMAKLLQRFLSDSTSLTTRNDESRRNFNKVYVEETENIASFLHLHYVTKKTNTPFWKDFTKNNSMPDDVKAILSIIKERPIYDDIDYPSRLAFAGAGCTVIISGTGMVTREELCAYKIPHLEVHLETFDQMIVAQKNVIPMLMSHRQFLDKVSQK